MHEEFDIDITTLPDDVDQLKQLLVEIAAENRFLREQFNLAMHRRYAASSERYRYPGQGELFDEAEASADSGADGGTIEAVLDDEITVPAHTRKRGRKPLPPELPRIEVIEDIPAAERVCAADGHPLHHIGEDISEQLDIIPAQVRVIRTIRNKYACRYCETGVVSAPAAPQLIPKSIATPGLLAYVAVGKYADSLPLYRQEKIFERLGIELSRSTLSNWMLRLGELLTPLLALMRAEMKRARVVHMDETTVQVLKEPGRAPPTRSYMWVTMSGAGDPAMVLYDYAASRGSDVPLMLLEGFSGYLVSDGYKGYAAVNARGGITGVGCWAHVR
ncbi:MAG: IS66 family transposase, partial [Thiogranum sp.]